MFILRSDAPKAITIPYLEGGEDISMNYLNFFDITPIDGCSLGCNYGDTCGKETTIS